MNLQRISLVIVILFIYSCNALCQLNQTDKNGLRQGRWVRNYPHGTKMYEGVFRDGHPVGEFRRYYENGTLKSFLIFSEDGRHADAVLYHPNGRIASKGRYTDQKKEGKWQFFSPVNENYLICEQFYKDDMRNGISLRFYPDSTVGDRTTYLNDQKNGDREQFYEDGSPYTKSYYSEGKMNGKFEAWFSNGTKMYSGMYKNDIRDGQWLIYNEDGSVKYSIEYKNGIPDNPKMDEDASNYIDALEKQKGKIPDPEITGEIW